MEHEIDLSEYHGLVVHLAQQAFQGLPKTNTIIEIDDLIQEGMIGLLRAAHSYILQPQTLFSTFAYIHIFGSIRDALRRLDPLNQSMRQQVREVETAKTQFAQANGREPLRDEIAAWMKVSVEKVSHLMALGQIRQIPSDFDAGLELAVRASQERDLDKQLLGEAVQIGMIEILNPIERQVLILRFWVGLELRKVGDAMSTPLQTVYKIEVRARSKMKEWLETRGWEVEDIFCDMEEQ